MPKPSGEPERADEAFSRALATAIRLLARRDIFESALRDRLIRADFGKETVNRVLERLRTQGVLNDERMVALRVASADSHRPAGRDRLRAKLVAEGAPESVVAARLDERNPDDEVVALASAIRARYKGPDGAAKAARWAVGRGFDEETVEAAIVRVFGGGD